MSLRADKKERTRRTLRSAAFRLFRARGFDATTVDEIASEAGVSRTTFFRYFPTKEAVLFGRGREIGEVFRQWIAGRPKEENPLEAFEGALLALARETARDRQLAQDAIEVRAIVEANPALRRRQAEQTQEQIDLIAESLAEREGRPVGADHRLAAGIGLLVSEETRERWLAGGGTDDVEPILREIFGRVRELSARRRRATD